MQKNRVDTPILPLRRRRSDDPKENIYAYWISLADVALKTDNEKEDVQRNIHSTSNNLLKTARRRA
jgi:hypothetical protein